MKIIDAFKISIAMIKKELKVNPEKQYKRSSGEVIKLKDVLSCYLRLSDLLYPELTDNDVVKVIRCKKCRHYCQVEGAKKTQRVWACGLSGERTPADGFCHKGCE